MPPNWMRVCLGSMFPLFWSDQPRSSAPVLREWNVAPWVLLIVCWESNNDPSRILMSPKKVFARFTFHSNVASFRLIYGGDILSPVAQLRGNVIIRTGTNSRTDWSDVEDRGAGRIDFGHDRSSEHKWWWWSSSVYLKESPCVSR